jgi:Protein of unknown function (DUF2489)
VANPDKRTSYLKKLVSASRAVVTCQVGLPFGCRRVAGLLFALRPFEQLDYPVFAEYGAATQDLPIGTERLYWSRDALRDKDVRLEAINRKFRDRLFEACYDILDRYSTPVDKPRKVT